MENSSAGWLPFCANQLAIFDRGYLHGNERKWEKIVTFHAPRLIRLSVIGKCVCHSFPNYCRVCFDNMEVRLFFLWKESILFRESVSFAERKKKKMHAFLQCQNELQAIIFIACDIHEFFNVNLSNESSFVRDKNKIMFRAIFWGTFFQFIRLSRLQDPLMKLHEWIM